MFNYFLEDVGSGFSTPHPRAQHTGPMWRSHGEQQCVASLPLTPPTQALCLSLSETICLLPHPSHKPPCVHDTHLPASYPCALASSTARIPLPQTTFQHEINILTVFLLFKVTPVRILHRSWLCLKYSSLHATSSCRPLFLPGTDGSLSWTSSPGL